MSAQTRHLPKRFFARASLFAILLLDCSWLRAEPPVAADTTVPNTFAFSSDSYFAQNETSNVMVKVEFIPGDRSWSGTVDFATSNGTAVAGVDYQATNGTLHFSGPGTPVPVITVPIFKNESRATNVTVELFLSNPNAYITRSHATLVIVDTNQPPPLQISRPNADSIQLCWPAIYSGIVLEKNFDLSNPSWNEVPAAAQTNNGYCSVFEPMTDPPAFYRLRKADSP